MKQNEQTPLQGLINHCARTRGAKTAVLNRLIRTGHRATWGGVSAWLHKDPAKRREPGLLMGMVLIGIWEEIKGGSK